MPNTSPVLHEVVEGAQKEFEGLRPATRGLHVEIANTVTNFNNELYTWKAIHTDHTTTRATFAPEEHDPKELHRQGGRVEELALGSCRLRGHNDPWNEEGTSRDRH